MRYRTHAFRAVTLSGSSSVRLVQWHVGWLPATPVCSIRQRRAPSLTDNRAMFTAAPGDVILRASIDGNFHVLDASSMARVAGPLPLVAALAYAHDHGAPRIFQQAADGRGRSMGDPARLGV